MDNIKQNWFFYRWREKLIAIVLASIVWYFVNQTIVVSKTIPNIPVRILNIPQDRVISGILPNGVYQNRVKLTLTGTRQVLENIEPGDLEVVLDANGAPDEWPVEISKKNLVSLNPDFDLNRHIREVSQPDLVIRLSRLTTADVPIYVVPPKGDAPEGYALLDISPRALVQSLTGPKDELQGLEKSGIALEFDLSKITKEELDKLPVKEGKVLLPILPAWKKIKVPWMGSGYIPMNSSDSSKMEMVFLKKEAFHLHTYLPLLVAYSIEQDVALNPKTAPLEEKGLVGQKEGISYLNLPLSIVGTDLHFAHLIAPHLAIVIDAEKSNRAELPWDLVALASQELEDRYVNELKDNMLSVEWGESEREERLRQYFRTYLSTMRLVKEGGEPLILDIKRTSEGITVENGDRPS
jgi:hypothetical protein